MQEKSNKQPAPKNNEQKETKKPLIPDQKPLKPGQKFLTD